LSEALAKYWQSSGKGLSKLFWNRVIAFTSPVESNLPKPDRQRLAHAVVQTRLLALAVLAVVATPSQTRADTAEEVGSATVRNIVITRRNIFGDVTTARYLTPRLINRLHTTTRESVIRREIWFSRGDLLDTEDLEELERNIRDLDLFAQVDVEFEMVPEDVDGAAPVVDVLVSTRDRLSIVASTGGSFLGGIGEVSTSVGEGNLFGLGHSLEFGYKENTEGELLGSFAYDNMRFADGDAIAGIRLGETEEGNFSGIRIRDEFDNYDDRLSWKIEYDRVETRIDYYDRGESVVEVPRTADTLSLNRIYRRGDRSASWRYGPLAEFKVTDYAAATGTQADSIAIPLDSTEVFAGGLLGYDVFDAHTKVNWLDSLDYEQDVSFGYGTEVALGASDTLDDRGNRIAPIVFLNAWWRDRLGIDEYASGRIETSYVVESGESDSWTTSVVARLYSRRLEMVTLASSLRYVSGFNGTGLPAEQSLGEDNGLRGYPAREFNGEQSLLLNLESRMATAIRLLTMRLGAVVFVDAGWVGDRDSGDFFDEAHASAGFGARLGSRELFGSGVFRLDIAFPFDDDSARDYLPTLSLSIGQVFSFDS